MARLFLAVLLSVCPGCLFSVMSGVRGMPVRRMRMVGRLLMTSRFVMFTRFGVVSSSVCGVLCCLLVVFRSFF